MQYGRKQIFTSEREISSDNLIKVLRQAMIDFLPNAADCNFLLKYEAGNQPLQRVKKYRSDIDTKVNDNIANEIVEFKLGFNWGSPITLVQRGEKDSGTNTESEAISLLNEQYDAEQIKTKTQQLARFIEICGIGYTFVDINADDDGESYFKIDVLDPRYAFVVRSTYYPDHRVVLGATFRQDDLGNYYFTCFTPSERFEVVNLCKIINGKGKIKEVDKWNHTDRSGEENPLGKIPIIEWIRSHDRMGCFERQLSEMDNLNLLISDFTNDVSQNTQAIWFGTNIEFPKDENGNQINPVSNDWLLANSTQDGKDPKLTPLAVAYDYQGIINQITSRRNTILQKCSVPIRYTSEGGGSTGSATALGGGYEAADSAANKQQLITESCKMEEVKVVLAAIRECHRTEPDNPMLELRAIDIQPKITRQRSYELVTKANALATLLSHGINGLQAFKVANLFEDVSQAWSDSREMVEQYQKSLFEKSDNENIPDRLDQDNSDQIENSPIIDGLNTKDTSREKGEN